MKKICLIPFIAAGAAAASALCAQAHEMDMYVSNQYVVRDMQTVWGFDMLPVMDIAGELGFNCSFDGQNLVLYNDWRSFSFTLGSASVYDQNGAWYGLDVVPQVIEGRVRVPAKFFQDAMGMSYVWDDVTNAVFLNSEASYYSVINSYSRSAYIGDYPDPISAGEGVYVVGCDEYITLRRRPSAESEAITKIPLFSGLVFAADMNNGFCRVTDPVRGVSGYVLKEYLDGFEPQVFGGFCTVVNCNTSISLRVAPYTDEEVITQIPLGARVVKSFVNERNGFYLVSYNWCHGWARADYLRYDGSGY